MQQTSSPTTYEYTRGCTDPDSCGEKGTETCTTENNVRRCKMCCSGGKCNGIRMHEHQLQEARQLLAGTATGKGVTLTSIGIEAIAIFLALAKVTL